MKILDREILLDSPPYVIAEMSGNHQGSREVALELLRECAKAGADALKLQTYTADSMTMNSDRKEYIIQSGPWVGSKLHDLYTQGHTPIEWLPDLFKEAEKLGIALFSTPFGLDEVEILEQYEVPAYKIASFELTFSQLLRKIALTGKPVILSTGMATLEEISRAIEVLVTSGSGPVAILKCTTSYPAKLESLNLKTIPSFIKKFGIPVGFSDHTVGNLAAISAVSLGATIIEKHVKLDRDETSVDATFSMPVSKLKSYIDDCNQAFTASGNFKDGPSVDEVPYMKYRRSIIANRNIPKGSIVTSQDFAILRPMIGLAPDDEGAIIGLETNREILRGEGIQMSFFDPKTN